MNIIITAKQKLLTQNTITTIIPITMAIWSRNLNSGFGSFSLHYDFSYVSVILWWAPAVSAVLMSLSTIIVAINAKVLKV
ncbi:hypothetical protein DMO16_22285 [Fictibacillus sp. S7]|nr:hypothetical protein DMO16_22285 [Fictibacillus sp. S7]